MIMKFVNNELSYSLNIIYLNILWNKLMSKLIKCILVNSDKVIDKQFISNIH